MLWVIHTYLLSVSYCGSSSILSVSAMVIQHIFCQCHVMGHPNIFCQCHVHHPHIPFVSVMCHPNLLTMSCYSSSMHTFCQCHPNKPNYVLCYSSSTHTISQCLMSFTYTFYQHHIIQHPHISSASVMLYPVSEENKCTVCRLFYIIIVSPLGHLCFQEAVVHVL